MIGTAWDSVNSTGCTPTGSRRAIAMLRVTWPRPTPLVVAKRKVVKRISKARGWPCQVGWQQLSARTCVPRVHGCKGFRLSDPYWNTMTVTSTLFLPQTFDRAQPGALASERGIRLAGRLPDPDPLRSVRPV